MVQSTQPLGCRGSHLQRPCTTFRDGAGLLINRPISAFGAESIWKPLTGSGLRSRPGSTSPPPWLGHLFSLYFLAAMT